jgi:hypothetical protein
MELTQIMLANAWRSLWFAFLRVTPLGMIVRVAENA